MASGFELPICPFCGFEGSDTYILMHHVETSHPENGFSPFVPTQDLPHDVSPGQGERRASATPPEVAGNSDPALPTEDGSPDAGSFYVECPTGCGEQIRFAEVPVHLDFHFAEAAVLAETGCEEFAAEQVNMKWAEYMTDAQAQVSKQVAQDLEARDFDSSPENDLKDSYRDSSRPSRSSRRKHKKSKLSKGSTSSRPSRRLLSKAELGPYANEKAMPTWLRKKLEEEPKVTRANKIQPDGTMIRVETIVNQTPGLIPVLSQLSGEDSDVERTFLCHPMVRHVFKLRDEGGFCGYRNIQTLISYIQEAQASGHKRFPGRMPTILALQDMIEHAWDMGYNTASKNEIGRIKNTRKYIGTSEAQALFLSLNIGCSPAAFVATKDTRAHKQLLEAVLDYFLQNQPKEGLGPVVQTALPPIYLQHSGHSLTIIGLEVRRDGSSCLLVFDPGFTQSPGAERIGRRVGRSNPGRILKAYRRDEGYLRRYKEYEILKLSPTSFPNEQSSITNQ